MVGTRFSLPEKAALKLAKLEERAMSAQIRKIVVEVLKARKLLKN
jgi:hypothetical protein